MGKSALIIVTGPFFAEFCFFFIFKRVNSSIFKIVQNGIEQEKLSKMLPGQKKTHEIARKSQKFQKQPECKKLSELSEKSKIDKHS